MSKFLLCMVFVFNFVQCESMFVPYESGPIDENTRGVYTHIKGEYSIRRDGIFVTVTSADGMEIEIHKVSDDGSSCLIKGTAHPELGEDDSN